jgi:hypothetical protein
MSSYDIAEKIRESLPGTEEILVQYLSGYLVDDASDDEDILQVARYILESLAMDKPDVLEQLMASLTTLLQDQLIRREKSRSGPKLQRLDKVLDMSKTGAMSNTIAFAEGVDLESINKGKCVSNICYLVVMYLTVVLKGHHVSMSRSWRSRKQSSRRRSRSVRGGTYTKVRSCSNRRRNRFDYSLFHLSLTDDDICFKQSYEEMFMKVRYILTSPPVPLNDGIL